MIAPITTTAAIARISALEPVRPRRVTPVAAKPWCLRPLARRREVRLEPLAQLWVRHGADQAVHL